MEKNRFLANVCQMRATHRYAFRSGQWATIISVNYLEPGNSMDAAAPRACYLVIFPDGFTDFWPVYDDEAGYEFRSAKVETSS